MTEQESFFFRTTDDEMLFNSATMGLPGIEAGEPAHCEPHSVRGFREALRVIEPFFSLNVFEVGFNLGHSAAIMLRLGATSVLSIDIRNTSKMRESERRLTDTWGDSFRVQFGVSVKNCDYPEGRNMAFIDGGHEYHDVMDDIRYCVEILDIKNFLFDDWSPIYGQVQRAVYDSNLLPLSVVGNMAICIRPDSQGYFNPFLK